MSIWIHFYTFKGMLTISENNKVLSNIRSFSLQINNFRANQSIKLFNFSKIPLNYFFPLPSLTGLIGGHSQILTFTYLWKFKYINFANGIQESFVFSSILFISLKLRNLFYWRERQILSSSFHSEKNQHFYDFYLNFYSQI